MPGNTTMKARVRYSSKDLLIEARLEKTSCAMMIIGAETRGYFTDSEKAVCEHQFPFDEVFTNAVRQDAFELATTQLIAIENQMAAAARRAIERYRDECKAKRSGPGPAGRTR